MENARWLSASAGLFVGLATGIGIKRMRHRRRSLDTVPYVDLARYEGRWFEIARYPTPFEGDCAKNATANYTLRGKRVRVVNSCVTSRGKLRAIEGWATVSDPETNAKLRVSFGPLARGDYWIVDLAGDYSYAVVGEPKRRFLWILSRTPQIDEHAFASICSRLPSFGYDPMQLRRTLQD